MDKSIYKYIIGELKELLPKEWKKIIFRILYNSDNDMYNVRCYIETDKKTIDCSNTPGVECNIAMNAFLHINSVLQEERRKLDKNQLWSAMVMIVESDGKVASDFYYKKVHRNLAYIGSKIDNKYLVNMQT